MLYNDPYHPSNLSPGITVRDHIAMEFMKAMITNNDFLASIIRTLKEEKRRSQPNVLEVLVYERETAEELATRAYIYADKLIEESSSP